MKPRSLFLVTVCLAVLSIAMADTPVRDDASRPVTAESATAVEPVRELPPKPGDAAGPANESSAAATTKEESGWKGVAAAVLLVLAVGVVCVLGFVASLLSKLSQNKWVQQGCGCLLMLLVFFGVLAYAVFQKLTGSDG